MSVKIRRQSILSSLVTYLGFAVGLLNTYFFVKEGLFTTEEYGLTKIFIDVAAMIASLSAIAMPAFVYKFYPYYNDNLKPERNDMLAWALLVGLAGFLLVMILGILFKDLVYRKFGANSPLFVTYYYWVFPFGLGLTIYNVLEAYAWSLHKSVFTTFLKEVEWRLLTTVLIVLFLFNIIPDFSHFIKLYALSYAGIAITLLIFLIATRKVYFVFRVSKVTRRFLKKIARFSLFIYGGGLVFTLSQVFDSFVIGATLDDGMTKVGIFSLAYILTGLIQAPQRGIIAASIPHLAQAWKDKNLRSIRTIYQRSSINLLIFAVLMFVLICLNYQQAVLVFRLKPEYLAGFQVFVLLGLMRIVDMGSGVNAQIIGTSTYWRFELVSGIVLLVLMLPLNYLLTKRLDILGPALANLISFSVYNLIRIVFLWKRYRLFPFTPKSVGVLNLGLVSFMVAWLAFHQMTGLEGLFARSLLAIAIFGLGLFLLKPSPDIQPVLISLINRGRRKADDR
ncbi:hypothetical protein GCM10027051_23030 [Niabella terrae]